MAEVYYAASWRLVSLLILGLVFAGPALAQGGGADGWVRADSIVATISETPVLETDILMEIDLGLLGSSHLGDDFEGLLGAYLNRILILKEVEEIGGFRLTAGQAEGAYQGYLLRYPDRETYEKKLRMWGIGQQEVFNRLSRALLASLYTESRIQFFVNILPSDIEKAYAEDRERWGSATVYEVWDTIRSELIQTTYRKERDRWLETLRGRYGLTIYNLNGESK